MSLSNKEYFYSSFEFLTRAVGVLYFEQNNNNIVHSATDDAWVVVT